MKPIFLFSLPRSGSTLLQRILSLNREIRTVSEPWILLPHFYSLKTDGVFAEYSHQMQHAAVEDFCSKLPGGRADYLAAVRNHALDLYRLAGGGDANYFLDKTPRYHLVVNEIFETFPDAKFIFLWRHPFAVVASIMETAAGGRWNLFRMHVDLYDGLENLVGAYANQKDRSLAVRYETLVNNPVSECSRIFDYLELTFDPAILDRLDRANVNGRFGDKRRTGPYDEISTMPIEKWKHTLANPFRKAWCRRYLKWIGRERLLVMGYDFDSILQELAEVPGKAQFISSDIIRATYGIFSGLCEPTILKRKFQNIRKWYRLYSHT